MADSDITNLPELIGTPATDDNMVIDDISDGVATRTKRVTVENLFDLYLGNTGVSQCRANSIGTKNLIDELTSLSNIRINPIVGDAALTLNSVASLQQWKLTAEATIFSIEAVHNSNVKPFQIASLAPSQALFIAGTGNVIMQYGITTNSISNNGPADMFIQNLGPNKIFITAGGGVNVAGLPFTNNHVNASARSFQVTVPSALADLYANLAGLGGTVGDVVPITGQIRATLPGDPVNTNSWLTVSHYIIGAGSIDIYGQSLNFPIAPAGNINPAVSIPKVFTIDASLVALQSYWSVSVL